MSGQPATRGRFAVAIGGLVLALVSGVRDAQAIPSPELIVGSIGSLSQLAAIVSALFGGGRPLPRCVVVEPVLPAWAWRAMFALAALAIMLAGLNIYQWQTRKQAELDRLSATLVRPTRLPGQPQPDATLKELSPEAQAVHRLGISTSEAEDIVADPAAHGYVILDIRETAEVEMGTFAAARRFDTLDLLAKGFDFGGRKALLICHNGNRSSRHARRSPKRGSIAAS
ncbi:MAG: rhodanese-like domain-containing protein [Hyphomicrobiaceae bacterium]